MTQAQELAAHAAEISNDALDQLFRQSRTFCISRKRGGKGSAFAGPLPRERRKNKSSAGHGHRRLGHRVLRETSPAISSRRYAFLFVGNKVLIDETAFRNSSLQGAYFILAARAVGLDCGPMSGFDAAKVNTEFFPDGKWKANFLCNLGYGDPTKLFPRNPRLEFDEACRVL